MARSNIEPVESPYYPPRARWYSRLLHPWFELRRVMHLEKLHLPSGLPLGQSILCLIVPGYAFFANGRRVLGWTFGGVYAVAALLFVVALGFQIGGIGFGLMISVHATSIIFWERFWLAGNCRFGLRLVLAALTLLVVWQAVYSPLVGYAGRHWIMPLQVRGRVVIVRRLALPHEVRRGDFVIYTLGGQHEGDGHRGGAVWLRSGFGWGPVLARAGERVEFFAGGFRVDGVTRPLLPHMPGSGEVAVPEKHWFIWPEFDIRTQGNVAEANIAALMLQVATVSEDQFVGKPFKHWFWRRQFAP